MIDLKKPAIQQQALAAFFFAYQAFTAKPDEILARRGLSRVHHRILFFIAQSPGLSVSELLAYLGVSKQALNAPLRQLIEMKLIAVKIAEHDKRVKQLSLTDAGQKLENQLTSLQMQHLETAFSAAGTTAEDGWIKVMAGLTAQ